MKQYELMIIVDPNLGSDAINSKLEEIKTLITSQKGEIYFEDIWGVKDLAYKIKKNDKGFYVVFNIKMESDGLKEIKSTLTIDKEILRHIMVTLPAGFEPKSLKDVEKEIELAKKEAEIEKVVEEKKRVDKRKDDKTAEGKTEKKEVVKEKVEEVVAEKAPEKEEEKKEDEKEKKKSLEDVDKKLSNLLDNPDLNF